MASSATKLNSTERPDRSNAVVLILRTIAHSSTSDNDTLNAARGLRRMAGDDLDGFLQRLLMRPATPQFTAPSVLQQRANQLEARIQQLEAENAKLTRTVDGLSKAQQADRGYIQGLQNKFDESRYHTSELNRILHRLASKAQVDCPCDGCKRKLHRTEPKQPEMQPQMKPEPKQTKPTNRAHEKVWTWERYRFLLVEHAKLVGGKAGAKYFDQTIRSTLTALFIAKFGQDGRTMPSMSKNSLVGALDRVQRNPKLAEPPNR